MLLDQSQNAFNHGYALAPSTPRWQTFTPTRESLSRVSVYLEILQGLTEDVELRILDPIGNEIHSEIFETGAWSTGWIDLSVPDVPMVPGLRYRIELVPLGEDADWMMPDSDPDAAPDSVIPIASWRGQKESQYLDGEADTSGESIEFDYAFKTYSRWELGIPDLVVESIEIVNDPNLDIAYRFTIKNIGEGLTSLDGATEEDSDNVAIKAYVSAHTTRGKTSV